MYYLKLTVSAFIFRQISMFDINPMVAGTFLKIIVLPTRYPVTEKSKYNNNDECVLLFKF